MLNLAPWYYRNLLGENEILEKPDNYQVILINGKKVFESNIKLKEIYRPSWLSKSALYKDCDGSGTSEFQNIAVYKAISESLERMAFYETIDNYEKDFCFDLNPTTTGMASFPHFFKKYARNNAKKEAIERWAIHEFNRNNLPVKEHTSEVIGLKHFEIVVPFSEFKVSVLKFKFDELYVYGFACGDNLIESFNRAIIELDRNKRVLRKLVENKVDDKNYSNIDKTFMFYASKEGEFCFSKLVANASQTIINQNPKLLCDKEIKGKWSDYTVVWRYLLENSYNDKSKDFKFFMF